MGKYLHVNSCIPICMFIQRSSLSCIHSNYKVFLLTQIQPDSGAIIISGVASM